MYKIMKAEKLADKIFLMDVHAPRVASHCEPGQFVIVKMDEKGERIPKCKKRNRLRLAFGLSFYHPIFRCNDEFLPTSYLSLSLSESVYFFHSHPASS